MHYVIGGTIMKNLRTFLLLGAVMLPATIASTTLCMNEQQDEEKKHRLGTALHNFSNRFENEVIPTILNDREIMDEVDNSIGQMTDQERQQSMNFLNQLHQKNKSK